MQQATQTQIEDLRNLFQAKFEETYSSKEDAFHPNDLARINNGDTWLRRFIDHNDGNVTEALTMLWETLEWRKKFGANDICESNLRMEYLIDGSIFTHNRDKDGCRLFIFKCKKHYKGQKDFDELKRCVVYWFERLEKMDNGKQLTLFFDMAETGLSNMDMEFTKYLIGLFKQYYPNFLNYILIFEMPWVLNAAFKIIKSWLPEKAVEKIKFVNKKTLSTYVTPEQSLKCWGGLDDYTFTFVPFEFENTADNDVKEINSVDSTNGNSKKVHFADGSAMSNISEKYEPNPNAILLINPPDVIAFNNDGGDLHGSFIITNKSKQYISYKVKTTSPEKFRVRPSSGCLAEGENSTINVALQPGFQLGGLSRDKFLVMCMYVDNVNMSVGDINELWKNNSGKQIEQHRLRCGEPQNVIVNRNGISILNNPADVSKTQLNSLINSVQKLHNSQEHLQRSIKRTEILQLFSLILFITISVIFFYIFQNQIPLESNCCSSDVVSSRCYRE